MGLFFKRLGVHLRKAGAETWQVCFNSGDALFAPRRNRISYLGTPEAWHDDVRRLLKELSIDTVMLFGDCRHYHRVAIEVAGELGVAVAVFEEGYTRPHFLTVEEGGVNDFSKISKDPGFYRKLTALGPDPETVVVKGAFRRMAFQASCYYMAMEFGRRWYPHYQHHRDRSPYREAGYGIRNVIRKFAYRFSERGVDDKMKGEWGQRYYFVPLQTECDAQVRVHSSFISMTHFIITVMNSFARHAPEASLLILKHHPMDRGVTNYSVTIKALARELGIEDRVHYYHDIHLPTALRNTLGTITINSTVGISSLVHAKPTLVLGRAMYDIEGLTCKGMGLDRFWCEARKPDPKLFRSFRRYVLCTTQVSGSFYTGFPNVDSLLQRLPVPGNHSEKSVQGKRAI
ncbi:capsule polysaccharide biosynthesis [Desulfoluna spongiiphila]|nr:capsule polysaccharide biosynthesis [Desulfoluna spongiiphila]